MAGDPPRHVLTPILDLAGFGREAVVEGRPDVGAREGEPTPIAVLHQRVQLGEQAGERREVAEEGLVCDGGVGLDVMHASPRDPAGVLPVHARQDEHLVMRKVREVDDAARAQVLRVARRHCAEAHDLVEVVDASLPLLSSITVLLETLEPHVLTPFRARSAPCANQNASNVKPCSDA